MSNRQNKKDPILKVNDLCVSYGKIAALKGISFDVYPGEIVAILGANGAGKTTTLNALTGVLKAKSGTALFKGENILGVPTNKITAKGMIHVPEGRHIFPALTVGENLRVAAYLYEKKNKDLFEERREYVFSLFPRLKERIEQAGGTLSGGEQQMLAMGRALMSKPKLLMLDEPSMGLAPILVDQIFDIIKELHAAGTTILLVEQNARAALSVANRGYVLETGKIVATGTGAELLMDESVKKAYLGG
jgi:branched-chain amino acid transport system ATP-binding protein